jgi:hypothetical protein
MLDGAAGRFVVKVFRDDDDTAPLEWERLNFAQRVTLPVPAPIAAHLKSAWFGRPAIVMSRLPHARTSQRKMASPESSAGTWEVLDADDDVALLPQWYQPTPMRGRLLTGWQRRIAIATIVAFVDIDAFGLCSTYGHVVFA